MAELEILRSAYLFLRNRLAASTNESGIMTLEAVLWMAGHQISYQATRWRIRWESREGRTPQREAERQRSFAAALDAGPRRRHCHDTAPEDRLPGVRSGRGHLITSNEW